ncbi:hypothetical protein CAPTEDRAFT_145194 [Capitella teleta]|uniref:G-protein coupled receptors family 3 profile domain-containing protein n=1 Tax=Capitella teleta TaxID=283909 RepID=R7TA52_CAPTE|nr:hypothetical protein CAPTEDRAFT_145194 [Capitella teleta]|eukprot:ELT90594.1 hypothetical protein CAPTEDRAFT_145194 [Capitella teleta]
MPIGPAFVPAMMWAVDSIHENQYMLPDYRIRMRFLDTLVSIGPSINRIYEQLYTPPVKYMLVGPGCSSVCQPLTESVVFWNVTSVSYGATSDSLSDRQRYPRFYRTVAPDSCVVPARMKIMEHFGWNAVSTVHQVDEIFSVVTDATAEAVKERGWRMVTSEMLTTDKSQQQIENLIRADARIVFLGFYKETGSSFLCEAYKSGFYGPHIVMVFMNWLDGDWYEDSNCTKEQILEVLDYSLFTGPNFINPNREECIAGIDQAEFDQEYLAYFNGTMPAGGSYRNPAFDSIWTVALALNATENILKENGSQKRLSDFTYADIEMANLITENVASVDFQGLQGRVKFNEEGGISPPISIEQQRGAERKVVGWYYPYSDKLEWKNGGIQWPHDKVPVDAVLIVIEHVYVSANLYAAMCAIACFGIMASTFFLVFNFYHRAKRVIKMTSPNINNMILGGSILCFVSILFADTKRSVMSPAAVCLARLATFVAGFSVVFGSLFAKTWRVHAILTTKKLKRNVISDSRLAGLVLILLTVNALIIVVWQAMDPYEVTMRNLTICFSLQSAIDADVRTIPRVNECHTQNGIYFTGALYVVQGLMMAFGAFLAWETRKVKMEALNDSKLIGVCIYNVLILSVLGTAIGFILDADPNMNYGFRSGIVLVGVILTIVIMFVPKVSIAWLKI